MLFLIHKFHYYTELTNRRIFIIDLLNVLLFGIHLDLMFLFHTYQIVFYVCSNQMHLILCGTSNIIVMYHEMYDFCSQLKSKHIDYNL